MEIRIPSVGTPGGCALRPDPDRLAYETSAVAYVASHVEARGGEWVLPGFAPGDHEWVCDDCKNWLAGDEGSRLCLPCTVRDGLEALRRLKAGEFVKANTTQAKEA